jgi:hypothetical protein
VTLDHFALHRMQRAAARETFNGNHFAPGQQTHRHKTTVDGAVGGFVVRVAFDDCDRARAAIALGAALLRAGKSPRAEEFQQRRVGRIIANTDATAIQNEFDCIGHTVSWTGHSGHDNISGVRPEQENRS